jgi:hypothetical protein
MGKVVVPSEDINNTLFKNDIVTLERVFKGDPIYLSREEYEGDMYIVRYVSLLGTYVVLDRLFSPEDFPVVIFKCRVRKL